jgi:hypothetical protein
VKKRWRDRLLANVADPLTASCFHDEFGQYKPEERKQLRGSAMPRPSNVESRKSTLSSAVRVVERHFCGMNAPVGSSSRQNVKLRRFLPFL